MNVSILIEQNKRHNPYFLICRAVQYEQTISKNMKCNWGSSPNSNYQSQFLVISEPLPLFHSCAKIRADNECS